MELSEEGQVVLEEVYPQYLSMWGTESGKELPLDRKGPKEYGMILGYVQTFGIEWAGFGNGIVLRNKEIVWFQPYYNNEQAQDPMDESVVGQVMGSIADIVDNKGQVYPQGIELIGISKNGLGVYKVITKLVGFDDLNRNYIELEWNARDKKYMIKQFVNEGNLKEFLK
ncbi:MAG: hypothetical protein ACRCTQ_03910, partial [Brevinemataceae bacterium]